MNAPIIQPTVNLGDLTEIVMGQAPPGDECNKRGNGTAFVKAGEFSDREPIIREWTTKPLKLAKKGDVLVCVVGATAGKINLGVDCAIGRSVAAIRPNRERLDTNYLHQFLRTRVERLRAGSQGLAQGVITREMLASLELPLPLLAEQRRIATILDKADLLRRKRKRTLELAGSLSGAIFVDMFGSCRPDQQTWPATTVADAGRVQLGRQRAPKYQTGKSAQAWGSFRGGDGRLRRSAGAVTARQRLWQRGGAMGYHGPEPGWKPTAGRAYLCRTVRRPGRDPHHLGTPPDPPRDQVLRRWVSR